MKATHWLQGSGNVARFTVLLLGLAAFPAWGGNFYAGTTPANLPWPDGIVPFEFTNTPTLTAAMKQTYLDGLREWELAAHVQFVPHTNQSRWILFTYNTNYLDNVSPGYSPQVVTVASLSRAQVGHEMGHSFGFTHENIRPDAANFITVLTNNIFNEPGNIYFFTIDPTSVTNGAYDFESVMHLGWDFASSQQGVFATQQPKPAYFPRYQFRLGNYALSPGDRAALTYLYGPPAMPLTNLVTTTQDSGPGSLRAAMYYVTDHPGAAVRFNIPTTDPGYSNGVFNIHLTGQLPTLAADGMIIDGATQPGFAGQPLIVIDASQIIPETFTSDTLLIYSANNQINNLSLQGFSWNGVTLVYADATNNTIAGCWIGLDATGSNAAPNLKQGIYLDQSASRNIIGGTSALARNVISGNREYGVWISGSNTTGNLVLGNYLGTDATGSYAVSNAAGGVILTGAAHHNLIGGDTASGRNIISGNLGAGLWITGAGAANNTVQGNFIGLNSAGTAAVANSIAGIRVENAATSNQITGNVVSGNASDGIRLAYAGTSANVVRGNFIGTDPVGATAIPNGFAGLTIYFGATSNVIGGTVASARNVVSGNSTYGAVVAHDGTSGNLIQGNYFGLGASGVSAVPNYYGILISAGATNNTLGGSAAGAGNFVSGNSYRGVFLSDPGTSGNFVLGNFIGTDRTGTNALGNYDNVELQAGAAGNFIGGVNAGEGNTIAFAGGTGVILYEAETTNNSIRGNSIFGSYYLGIDLGGDGVTANDPGDGDSGPNNLQNFPVITNAFGSGSSTVISGSLSSATNRAYFIDVYRNPSPDYTGYGEGQSYVGTVPVITDGSGSAIFSLTASGNFSGQYFSATATDQASGDTSEFSLAVPATNGPAPPTFLTPFSLTSTGFTAKLSLTIGQNYRVQATTNLGANPVAWLDLTNFVASATNFLFLDHSGANLPRRFYRAVSP